MTGLVTAIRQYDGSPVRFMEVCGTHTAAIAQNGIRSLLPETIRLVSGPGCPVCVTVTAYLDRLIALSKEPDTVVVSFGDLLRVPGSKGSLSDGKAEGGRVRMVYSPMEVLDLAGKNPDTTFVFAAVGFETTAPGLCPAFKAGEGTGDRKHPPAHLSENHASGDRLGLPEGTGGRLSGPRSCKRSHR